MRWLKGINSSSSNKVFGQLALRCQFSFCIFFLSILFFFCVQLVAVGDWACQMSRVCKLIDGHVRCDAAAHNTETLTMIHHSFFEQITFLFGVAAKEKKRFLSGEDSVAHFFVGLLFLLIISILRRFVYRYADFLLIVIISANLRDGCSFICFTYS